MIFFFFQAEDGIRDLTVTGVQTCALPILAPSEGRAQGLEPSRTQPRRGRRRARYTLSHQLSPTSQVRAARQIGRASCREREEISVEGGALRKKIKKMGRAS